MRSLTAFFVMCAVLWLAGCGPGEGVLAVVGNSEVEIAAFQEHLAAATGEAWESATGPVASRLLDQFLEQEVVLVVANREARPDVPAEPGNRSAQVRLLLDELCGPPPPPDDDVVHAAMAEALAEERPARAQVRQMLLDSREQAEDAARRLDEGADFVELSKAVSRAPNAAGGGHLGLLTQGGLPENLDEVYTASGCIGGRCECGAWFVVDETGRLGGAALMDLQALAAEGDLDRALEWRDGTNCEIKDKSLTAATPSFAGRTQEHDRSGPRVWALKQTDSGG